MRFVIDDQRCPLDAIELVAIQLSRSLILFLLDLRPRSVEFLLAEVEQFLIPFYLSMHAWNDDLFDNQLQLEQQCYEVLLDPSLI